MAAGLRGPSDSGTPASAAVAGVAQPSPRGSKHWRVPLPPPSLSALAALIPRRGSRTRARAPRS